MQSFLPSVHADGKPAATVDIISSPASASTPGSGTQTPLGRTVRFPPSVQQQQQQQQTELGDAEALKRALAAAKRVVRFPEEVGGPGQRVDENPSVGAGAADEQNEKAPAAQ